MLRARYRIAALADSEGVSIVRPVCGVENFAEETLASALGLEYPCNEILFCVAHAADDVVPLVRRLIAAHPDVPARLLVGNDPVSINPKLNNMVKGWTAAKHPWIVMADSNVLMTRDYLLRLVQTWQADTGLVSSPSVGCAAASIWAEIECDFLNTYQARWQCFVDSIGLGFAQGKTMLWRKDILESGGGIRALASEAAEDAAATKLVRRQGLRVRLVAQTVRATAWLSHWAAEVWCRQVRWARLRRVSFPHFFAPEIASGAAFPAFVALLAADLELDVACASALLVLMILYGMEAA